MSVSISEIRVATDYEWDELWQECETSTYFHSREWAEIWSSYTNGKTRPAPKLVLFSDDKKALLPLSTERIMAGLVQRLVSSPAGTFGGWLSKDSLGLEHTKILCNLLANKFGNIVWRINPYDSLAAELLPQGNIQDETEALNLSKGFDAIHKSWTKGHSSAARKARKARKAGVNIIRASSLQEFRSYYQIYEDSLRRWGSKATSRYDWDLFREIFERSSSNIILWLALYEDTVVAGALCFYSTNHVVYWHGAALEKYFSLRPVNLLLSEAIKHACSQGFSWFDFNPSGGHDGVLAFKRSFGTESKACPVVVRRDWRQTAVKAVSRRLHRK